MKAKKITALLLAATMIVSMTACGGNSNDTPTAGNDTTQTTPADDDADADTDTDAETPAAEENAGGDDYEALLEISFLKRR